MSLLARFEAIEKEVEKNKIINNIEDKNEEYKRKENENKKKEKENNEEENWFEKKKRNKKIENKIKLTETRIKTVPLSTLVWSTLLSMKGGASFVFCRICSQAEIAHYKFHDNDLTLEGLIPPGKIIVEYLSLPENFPQYALKDPGSIKPYNENIHTKELGPIDSWNEHTRDHMLNIVLKRKYNSQESKYIFDQSYAVANEFLRLALKQQNEELNISLQEESTITPTDVLDLSQSPFLSIRNSDNNSNNDNNDDNNDNNTNQTVVDMSLFVSNNSPVKCNLTLSAGDWIGYDDKIFKTPKISQIIEITKSHTKRKSILSNELTPSPLILANGDILFLHDLVCKYYHSIVSSPTSSTPTPSTPTKKSKSKKSSITEFIPTTLTEHLGYFPIEEYKLKRSKLNNTKSIYQEMAKETKEQVQNFENESGITLNTKKRRTSLIEIDDDNDFQNDNSNSYKNRRKSMSSNDSKSKNNNDSNEINHSNKKKKKRE